MSKKAKLGRGQLHSRNERSWRDGTNPGTESARAGPQDIEPSEAGPIVGGGHEPLSISGRPARVDPTTSTDGPGGGGATEWSGRTKHQEGLHGGPSRKT